MMIQGHDDTFLAIVFFCVAIVIPGIVLLFDDSKIHSNQKS